MSDPRSSKPLTAPAVVAASIAALLVASIPGAAAAAGPDDDAPPQRQVFASPFGEPFLAGPTEPYPVIQWFEGADADQDGRLTPDEFAADGQRWFGVVDQNADGEISPAETRAYEDVIARLFAGVSLPAVPGRRGGSGRPGRRSGLLGALSLGGAGQEVPMSDPVDRTPRRTYAQAGTPLAMAGLLNVPQPVKTADTNTNQRITQQEWAAVTLRWFGLLDANRDGVLTLAELPETQLQAAAHDQPRGRRR